MTTYPTTRVLPKTPGAPPAWSWNKGRSRKGVVRRALLWGQADLGSNANTLWPCINLSPVLWSVKWSHRFYVTSCADTSENRFAVHTALHSMAAPLLLSHTRQGSRKSSTPSQTPTGALLLGSSEPFLGHPRCSPDLAHSGSGWAGNRFQNNRH